MSQSGPESLAYLDIVASVVVAAFSEQSMSHYSVNVQSIKYRIGVLSNVLAQLSQSVVREHYFA